MCLHINILHTFRKSIKSLEPIHEPAVKRSYKSRCSQSSRDTMLCGMPVVALCEHLGEEDFPLSEIMDPSKQLWQFRQA